MPSQKPPFTCSRSCWAFTTGRGGSAWFVRQHYMAPVCIYTIGSLSMRLPGCWGHKRGRTVACSASLAPVRGSYVLQTAQSVHATTMSTPVAAWESNLFHVVSSPPCLKQSKARLTAKALQTQLLACMPRVDTSSGVAPSVQLIPCMAPLVGCMSSRPSA